MDERTEKLIKKKLEAIDLLRTRQERLHREVVQLRVSNKELVVSDHALVRYLERTRQLPIDEIKAGIITPLVQRLYGEMGDGQYPIDSGSTAVVIHNGVIVTIIVK